MRVEPVCLVHGGAGPMKRLQGNEEARYRAGLLAASRAGLALLSKGASLTITATNGATALHLAAVSNRADVVGMFISAKADVEAKTYLGATPLYVAVAAGCLESVRALPDPPNYAFAADHERGP